MGSSLVIAGTVGAGLSRADDKEPKHVGVARELVKNLDLKNTSYEHGKPDVQFAAPYKSHADCSGFLQALLQHSYGYRPEQFKTWFGHERPTADHYHDTILKHELFDQITDFRRARSGDILAIKYKNTKDKNTGHVMLVVGAAQQLKAQDPLEPGTEQWEVTVIDSSRSGHGKTDTRHGNGPGGKDHDGLGQGILRVYTDKDGKVEGYTWSVGGKNFMSQQEENMVIGRLKSAIKP
jgi:cell wall-associated NlpC family hydrolase